MRTLAQIILLAAYAFCAGASSSGFAQTPAPTPSPMPKGMPMPTPTASPAEMKQEPASGQQQPPPKLFPPPKDWPKPVDDEHRYSFLLADLLEFSPKGKESDFRWDTEGWYGGDFNRLWFKSEGEQSAIRAEGNIDFQLLYGRFVKRYYDLQLGARAETRTFRGANVTRGQAVIGIEGLVPYRYDIEALLFISHQGDVSGRFTFTREYMMTQRWVLQPRFETNIAAQRVERFGVGKGLNDIELGLRLRYAIRREFAPYIGVSYKRSLFGAADLMRQDGKYPSQVRFVVGVRVWH